jgi:hypothetical protein
MLQLWDSKDARNLVRFGRFVRKGRGRNGKIPVYLVSWFLNFTGWADAS